MRSFMRLIDRFCITHPRFGIPGLMRYIVIATGLVWVLGMMDTTGAVVSSLYFSPQHIMQGQIWRLFTFALVPESYGFLIIIELYFSYFIGNTLEQEWGSGRFTIFYLMGMLLTAAYCLFIWFAFKINLWTNAHYLNMSMFFAFASIFPETVVLLFFVIPVKVKWLALVDAVYFIRAVAISPFPFNLIPLVAVFNFALFCGADLLRAFGMNIRAQTSKNSVNFRREAKKIIREQKSAGYTKKCAVCGRTDADSPNLDFRYCSRCNGFHCFCEEHINNHVHFTE